MTSAAFSGNGYVHLNLYNFHQKGSIGSVI